MFTSLYVTSNIRDDSLALQGIGEPILFLGSSVFFAIKHAAAAARLECGLIGPFSLDSPATPEKACLACASPFTQKVKILVFLLSKWSGKPYTHVLIYSPVAAPFTMDFQMCRSKYPFCQGLKSSKRVFQLFMAGCPTALNLMTGENLGSFCTIFPHCFVCGSKLVL